MYNVFPCATVCDVRACVLSGGMACRLRVELWGRRAPTAGLTVASQHCWPLSSSSLASSPSWAESCGGGWREESEAAVSSRRHGERPGRPGLGPGQTTIQRSGICCALTGTSAAGSV